MAEFRAFPISDRPRRTYMLIRLNRLIFRRRARLFDPDFFWVQFGSAASVPAATGSPKRAALEGICEPFHDPLMKDVIECRQRMGEVAMANRLFDVLARRRSWLDRVALGLLVFLATLVAALMGGAGA
ncbi:hypothetical protein [Mesorhizobium sp. J8]|uniref:hypothetical protein n=1 Tax=Mesorhizobium sp. J8 TaxID=2777475 RepID=UPI0019151620|nr:hypothetical protein [Mesorhizobium sp. J8]BCM18793.1 hypothetical protein MJ8_25650 [Mesorhizobium sp. J8]